VGTLILYGNLYGYGEHDDCRKSCRGRRIFCNNRKAQDNGCGHTFSVFTAQTLKRLRIGAKTLWNFFSLILRLGNIAQAHRTSAMTLSLSSAYRLRTRFDLAQSHLRSALVKLTQTPQFSTTEKNLQQTLTHLRAAFSDEDCPILAFQARLQIHFFA
jgi:hypothetical protein